MKSPAITIRENRAARAMFERTPRFDVFLHGKTLVGQLYFNMTGFTGCNLPLPNGRSLLLPECGIAAIRREIAAVNREWSDARSLSEK